jgi:two-component system, chemotaxis family, response regulator Rcp1
MTAKRVKMLLVEDNPADVYFVRHALEELSADVNLEVVTDGQQAMDFLRSSAGAGVDVMVLDLNLPVKSGREVLAEMGADPRLRHVPVAILTTSTSEDDAALQQCKEKCLFFVKTADLGELGSILSEIHAFALMAR